MLSIETLRYTGTIIINGNIIIKKDSEIANVARFIRISFQRTPSDDRFWRLYQNALMVTFFSNERNWGITAGVWSTLYGNFDFMRKIEAEDLMIPCGIL